MSWYVINFLKRAPSGSRGDAPVVKNISCSVMRIRVWIPAPVNHSSHVPLITAVRLSTPSLASMHMCIIARVRAHTHTDSVWDIVKYSYSCSCHLKTLACGCNTLQEVSVWDERSVAKRLVCSKECFCDWLQLFVLRCLLATSPIMPFVSEEAPSFIWGLTSYTEVEKTLVDEAMPTRTIHKIQAQPLRKTTGRAY